MLALGEYIRLFTLFPQDLTVCVFVCVSVHHLKAVRAYKEVYLGLFYVFLLVGKCVCMCE